MHTFWLISPIIIVLGIALYFIWALRKRDRHYQTKKAIMKSGDRGEYKVQAVLRVLQKPNSKYRVYHNIKLGPDPDHTNEYDTLCRPNGIFHIETKNYGGGTRWYY